MVDTPRRPRWQPLALIAIVAPAIWLCVAQGAGCSRDSANANAGGDGGGDAADGAADGGQSADDDLAAGGDGGIIPPPASRGATLPYWEYEAESATTNGVVIGPSRTFGELAAEASGRRAVRLEATGQHVQFTLEHPTNSIVVRYAIPDAPGGGGSDATLGLYVDGVRKQSLSLTSRYAWIYGGESGSTDNTPGAGAHHFYDEAHALIGEVPAGATIALQRDAGDGAPYYVIDLVDFEEVPPPLPQPAGSLSITDFGATPDDAGDDGPAIQSAIAAAHAQGKVLWIPRGRFESTSAALTVAGVTIRGAGMWYSTLHGFYAQLKVSGNDNRFYDFALFGDVVTRNDQSGDNGLDGPAGTGSRLENVWIEHQKVGWWVGKGTFAGVPTQPLTDGLVIHGARIRDTFADGVNFCNGTSNSVVEQSHFRNTGDDSLAAWSPSFDGVPDANNNFRFNTVQAPWRANCFAIYGGSGNKIEDNVCADTVIYPGIQIASTSAFSPHPFAGTTAVARNTLTRAGGPMYNQQHGALKLFADANAIAGVQIDDLLVEDATFSGIHIQGPQAMSALRFANVKITGAGTVGILVNANAHGGAQADNVVVTNAAGGGLQNDAAAAWSFTKGNGNSGW